MPETQFTIPCHEGETFFASEWSPEGKSKAVILMIHGLSDHAGRYRHVGSFFAGSGYTVIIPDLRGHGRSFGKRGHFPSYDIVMQDISLFLETAWSRHPGLPVILYGHSMGGNLVLNYLVSNKPPVAGAVVTSPWLRLNIKPALYKAVLAITTNRIFPSLTQPDGVIPSFLSHDEEVVRKYIADPLVHSLISVRTYIEISRAGEFALKHADEVACPLLLMHGTGDRLTSFDASREFADKAEANITFKSWEGLYHELHNEIEKEQVLDFIRTWVDGMI
jgi:alpha-beta hydrolase superfamily lysophospholipase